jgi:SAM-dependent methyltransferase
MTGSYPLAMSSDEIGRLRAQGELFRPDAQRLLATLELPARARCLDLCSGIGGVLDLLSARVGDSGSCLGLDLDAEKLTVAQRWAEGLGLSNVSFQQGDAFATGLASSSFDLVHTRFAVGIVPQGLGILAEAMRLARPGGLIVLEEADVEGYCCHPHHPAWTVALDAMVEGFRAIGSDLTLGRRLAAEVAQRGGRITSMHAARHALTRDHPMHFHLPMTLAAMRESVVASGILTGVALDQTVSALSEHLGREDTTTLSFTAVQVVARRG